MISSAPPNATTVPGVYAESDANLSATSEYCAAVAVPVKLPTNVVVVSVPALLLKVKLVPVLGGKLPVAAVTKSKLQEVSELSSAAVTVVAIAAVPDVFWLPAVLTPGKLIAAVPSKLTPPIALAVAKAVAVSASVSYTHLRAHET